MPLNNADNGHNGIVGILSLSFFIRVKLNLHLRLNWPDTLIKSLSDQTIDTFLRDQRL